MALREAFSGPYVIQDDGRQHVFWMQRFLEPGAFPGDLVADYFQAMAPAGYVATYRTAAEAGIPPVVVAKLLPFPLALLAVLGFWGVAWRLRPDPIFAGVAAILMCQSLWMTEEVISATPRAFAFPLLMVFLGGVQSGRAGITLAAVGVLAGTYPPMALVAVCTLCLRAAHTLSRRTGTMDWRPTALAISALVLAGVIGLGTANDAVRFGPVLTVADGRRLPDMGPDGRNPYFLLPPALNWTVGNGNGILGEGLARPLTLLSALVLPFIRRRRASPAAAEDPGVVRGSNPGAVELLWQLVAAGIGLFAIAYLLAFRLYLPGRYAQYPLRVAVVLAAGMVLSFIVERLWSGSGVRRIGAVALAVGILVEPHLQGRMPVTKYVKGSHPALYEFLLRQPADRVLVSLSPEGDNLQAFARRSVLFSREVMFPWHVGYYRELQQRLAATIDAQYAPDLYQARQLIRRYGVGFWLVDRDAFSEEYVRRLERRFLRPVPFTSSGRRAAISTLMTACAAFSDDRVVLLDAACVLDSAAAAG